MSTWEGKCMCPEEEFGVQFRHVHFEMPIQYTSEAIE